MCSLVWCRLFLLYLFIRKAADKERNTTPGPGANNKISCKHITGAALNQTMFDRYFHILKGNETGVINRKTVFSQL
jgi:hypothetical protein